MKRVFVLASLFALALLIVVSCSSDEASNNGHRQATTEVGAAAAAPMDIAGFSFALRDLEGNVRQSAEWIGQKPVVINVWGTWCPPCRQEIPELVRLYDEYKDQGVEMIGLTVLRAQQPGSVQDFAADNDMDWQMLVATQDLLVQQKIMSVPTTIFIDRTGNIVEVPDYNGQMVTRYIGPRSYEVFKKAFEKITQS